MPTRNANEALTAPVDAGSVERYRDDLRELAGDPPGRVLVALSGGPDSVALLLLAQAALGPDCLAATVDHGIRPASAAEAAWAADLCAQLGVAHAILRDALPDRAGRTANLSARARALRYRLLETHADAVGAAWIATAHHADDQTETMLMRLNRGAGVGGLASIRRRTGRVIRPLLGWRRAELAALVAAAGIDPVDDPGNRDDRYDRARLRKALAGADWLDRHGWAASALALAEADDALGWITDRLAAERIADDGAGVALDPAGLPPALVRLLVARCLVSVDPGTAPDGPALSRLIAALSAGNAATAGGVAVRPGQCWRFRPAPPRRHA